GTGINGSAMQFNGTTSYVSQTLPAVVKSPAITLETWVKVNALGNYQALMSAEPSGAAAIALGADLGLSPDGTPFFEKGSGDGSWELLFASSPISVGVWHHVAATYDGAVMRIFVDGVQQVNALADTSGINWTDQPGTYPNPGQLYFGAHKSNQIGGGD